MMGEGEGGNIFEKGGKESEGKGGEEKRKEEEKDKRTDVLFWRADDADIGSRELCPEVDLYAASILWMK